MCVGVCVWHIDSAEESLMSRARDKRLFEACNNRSRGTPSRASLLLAVVGAAPLWEEVALLEAAAIRCRVHGRVCQCHNHPAREYYETISPQTSLACRLPSLEWQARNVQL